MVQPLADDADLKLASKMLPALAFVPQADVVQAFEGLALPDRLDELVDYFEDNYVHWKAPATRKWTEGAQVECCAHSCAG